MQHALMTLPSNPTSTTMTSIDSLLNREQSTTAAAVERRPSQPPATQAHTTFEAADALTTLATLGSGQQYAPSRELPSPTAFAHPQRRSSSFSSHVAPVEPEPPVDPPPSRSPTLEHYHHGSKSPEERHRQSLLPHDPNAPVLAPIQNLDTLAKDKSQIDTHGIKNEPSENVDAENADVDTLKAIEVAKQSDLGLRTKRNASVVEGVTSPTAESRPAPSKKRPAPGSSSAIKKKGTATTKKPSKKRRIDTDSDANTRSVTPTSRPKFASSKNGKRGSQAGTPVAGSSPAPENASQAHPSDDEGDSSEDTTLYCICKKPDNHRWMIGCDGGCDDWFHGSCVNMVQSDEDLVDKFICPMCEEKGRGQTTWKPMCRRDVCRKPARLTKGKESKYCSDECGAAFFAEQLQRTAGAKSSKSKKLKKKNSKTDDNGDASDDDDDDDEPTPLGGVLRAKDLKALLEPCKDIQAFRNLGSGVLSPPKTASPTQDTFNGANGRPVDEGLSLTKGETERLNALFKEKSQLQDRLEVLKDREKFVSMAKEQAARVAEREKIKVVKEFCGYDSRLSWSDAEFLRWRNSKHGRAAFEYSTLSPTNEQVASIESINGEEKDVVMTDADSEQAETERVCIKKRCSKHPQWQKLNLQDARFEELEIAQSIKECEKEERSVKERARRRGAKDAMAMELTNGKVGRNREGWVEMVGAE